MKNNSVLKVGILTLVALVILMSTIFWLKGRSVSRGERINICFHDVAGLKAGAPVQMMGVRVGQIEKLTPCLDSENSHVEVQVVITEPTIKIPEASLISIQQSGIIGEKFIEISPPPIKIAYIPKQTKVPLDIDCTSSIQIFLDGNYENIGEILSAKLVDTRSLSEHLQKDFQTPYAYIVEYRVNKVGIVVPSDLRAKVTADNNILLIPLHNEIVRYKNSCGNYTVLEPIRISDFLDVQLQAAEAFNEINKKINTLLSDKVLDDTAVTLANIRQVSVSAADTVAKADELITSSRGDIKQIVALTNQLTKEVTTLTINLNSLVCDDEFKNSITRTANSLDLTSRSVNTLLMDKNTQDTLKYLRETSQNMAELTSSVNEITKDEQFRCEVKMTAYNLNQTLVALEKTLSVINNLSPEDKEKIHSAINDTAEISKNLKKFSEKLNKKFLLFRLMF